MTSNVELLINYVQNIPCIWGTLLNLMEEKELSWSRISDALGCLNGSFLFPSLNIFLDFFVLVIKLKTFRDGDVVLWRSHHWKESLQHQG